MSKFKLEIIDPESTSLHTILGISEERSDELVDLAKEAYTGQKFFSDTLDTIVSKVDHLNELVFTILLAGRMHDQNNLSRASEELELSKTMIELLKLKLKLNDGK